MNQQIKDAQTNYQHLLNELNKKSDRFADFRLITFIIFIISGIIYWQNHHFSWLLFTFIILLAFFVLIIKHSKIKKEIKTYESFLRIIAEYFSRLDDNWRSFPSNGSNYINNDLAKDLNLLGPSSLFQLINISIRLII